ncbi:MAG TPA: glycosyltransferase family 2 protein [Chthoniobacterales bacterium]|nr:glycosyltransferase family 2 protein [Chthoniobacterales bacterium]
MNLVQSPVTVLIPALNEEQSLANTVSEIEKHRALFPELEVIVINDGSHDRTAEIARTLPVTLIEHEITRGYGASLKSGLRRAKGELIIITDADGTYPLEELPRLVAETAEFDMIVGARTGDDVHIPALRRFGKWIITQLAEYLTGQHIPDLNSGLRLFRKDIALRFLPIYPDGFSITSTLTLAMLTNGYRVKFLPINYRKRVGKSSIHPIRDFINFAVLVIRISACFKPLNVFIPPAVVLILLGVIKGAIDYAGQHHLGGLSITMTLTGIQTLFIGLLADLIVQRMKL